MEGVVVEAPGNAGRLRPRGHEPRQRDDAEEEAAEASELARYRADGGNHDHASMTKSAWMALVPE